MTIRTGGHEVLHSGTVIVYKGQDIRFELEGLVFRFLFVDEPDNATRRQMFWEAVSGNELKCTLTNFQNTLGDYNTDALTLGTLRNRELQLNFRVYGNPEDRNKTFVYTWYLGEEVVNG